LKTLNNQTTQSGKRTSIDIKGWLNDLAKRAFANTFFAVLMTFQLVLPAGVIRWWIKPGGYIYYYIAPKTRRAMFANARHLLGPEASEDRLRRLVLAMMTNWCEFMVDLFWFQRVSREKVMQRTPTILGLDEYLEARKRGRGAIIVSCHLGNWEYGSVLLQMVKETLNVVFQRDPNVVLRRVFTIQRATKNIREMPIEGDPFAWVALREALKRDELVLLQGDRTIGEQGSIQPFVDGHARFPEGPVKLAMASGAPLVPVFVPRVGSGFEVHMYKPMFPDEPGVTEETLMRYMVESIEKCVTTYPEQWLMPKRFWVD